MQRHHEGRRAAGGRNLRDQPFGSGADHREGALAGVAQVLADVERKAGFEHGGVVEEIRTSFVDLYNLIGKEKSNLESDDKQFINQVFTYFCQEDNETLGNFSHDDPAWKLGKEQGNFQVMPLDDKLINYYADFLDDLLEEVVE
jgi:hypothetical protein